MFAGFELKMTKENFEDKFYRECHEIGKEIKLNTKAKLVASLDSIKDDDGNLIASKIESDWFPIVNSHVFLSHSRLDIELATAISGFFKLQFGVDVFVDSSIWQHMDKLLSLIDKEYSYSEGGELYDYKLRNISTSHVHMLLASALTKMIDKCECLVFLNTENSVPFHDSLGGNKETLSAWLSYEILISKTIQRRRRSQHRGLAIASVLNEALNVRYPINTGHLHQIGIDDIIRWQSESTNNAIKSLDTLYKLQGVEKI